MIILLNVCCVLGTVEGSLCIRTYLGFKTALWISLYYYPSFSDEDTETCRYKVPCPQSPANTYWARKWVSYLPDFRSLVSIAPTLPFSYCSSAILSSSIVRPLQKFQLQTSRFQTSFCSPSTFSVYFLYCSHNRHSLTPFKLSTHWLSYSLLFLLSLVMSWTGTTTPPWKHSYPLCFILFSTLLVIWRIPIPNQTKSPTNLVPIL